MFKRWDKTWYKFLVQEKGGLLSKFTVNDLIGKIVVQHIYNDERSFTIFDNYVSLSNFQSKFKPEYRCFHEVIFGGMQQKMRFDFDKKLTKNLSQCEDECWRDVDDIIDAIIDLIPNFNLEKDLCIYISNSEKKFSCHIISPTYCHSDNEDAKAFRDKVFEKLTKKEVNPWSVEREKELDGGIYNTTSFLRILGSTKERELRPKIFLKTFKYKGREITHKYQIDVVDEKLERVVQMNESLITFTFNCNMLPLFRGELVQKQKAIRIIDDEIALKCFEMLEDHPLFRNDCPFEIYESKGSLICLTRLKPSYCNLCSRVHDGWGPYLTISQKGTVYFHCRSAERDKAPIKSFFIGNINGLEEYTDPTDSIIEDNDDSFQKILESISTTDIKIQKEEDEEKEISLTTFTDNKQREKLIKVKLLPFDILKKSLEIKQEVVVEQKKPSLVDFEQIQRISQMIKKERKQTKKKEINLNGVDFSNINF